MFFRFHNIYVIHVRLYVYTNKNHKVVTLKKLGKFSTDRFLDWKLSETLPKWFVIEIRQVLELWRQRVSYK